MSKVELDQEEEKPLDPEMEKVRRKMVRLLVVSIGIMILGVMAVLAGVVYKVIEPDEEGQAVASGSLTVPSGAPLQRWDPGTRHPMRATGSAILEVGFGPTSLLAVTGDGRLLMLRSS